MSRFPKNRWALILTLAVFATLGTMRVAKAELDPTGTAPPDPQSSGDPDVPDGRTNTTAKSGYPLKRWASEEAHAGDVSALRTDGLWRLILILKGLRLFTFRF